MSKEGAVVKMNNQNARIKNQLSDALSKISEYEDSLEMKEELIQAFDKKLKEERERNILLRESLNETTQALNEKKEYETVRSVDYWKGIEKAYIEKLDEYLERIIALEKRNFLLEVENEELKNMNYQP